MRELDDLISRTVKKITVSERTGIRGIEYSSSGDILHIEVNKHYVKCQGDSFIEILYPFRLMDRSLLIIFDKKDEEYSIRDIHVRG